MRKNTITAIAALLILLSLAAGTAFAETATVSPTTGLATDQPYRPFLVTVSNAPEARPAWNLSEADIVYEMIIWGPGHTRYAAIYNDNHPKRVGPVRSARTYYAYLRQEWDCPLVHNGGMGDPWEINDILKIYNVPTRFRFDAKRTGPYSEGIGRDSLRVSPHNLVVNLSLMLRDAWPLNPEDDSVPHEPGVPLFQFSQTPTQGEQPALEIEIHYEGIAKEYPNYFPRYEYNPTENAYERWEAGYKQYDDESGKRIIAHNVIVQYCQITYMNKQASQPVIALLGEGEIDAFIDGKRIVGTWRRETMNDKTQFFDSQGDVLLLRPGKTFIQIVPTAYGHDYDAATTLHRYAPDL